MRRSLLTAVLALAILAGMALYLSYRQDMRQAHAAIRDRSLIVETAAGPIEYADRGDGPVLLSVHGAGGGFDQGLSIARGMAGDGFRIVAPSRFGYLRTPVPQDVSPEAQADAHAALLDALGVERAVVMGASAGARSALRLAMRHPGRVSALILVVPATYFPDAAVSQGGRGPGHPVLLDLVTTGADFVWWSAMRVAPSLLVRFIGVPPALLDTLPDSEREEVMRMVRAVLPLSERARGIAIDSVSDPGAFSPGDVGVPTLIVSARDDLFDTVASAEYASSRIARSELIVYDTGGHLLLGHGPATREAVLRFLHDAGLSPAGR